MATIDELRARAELIAEENQIGGNTAERVGEAFDMVADIIEAVAPGDEQAVLYNPQSPNETQKAQARANIGAQETIPDIEDFVKVSAQTFTAAQKQQARENIGAEQAGGAVKNLAGSASDTETLIKAANNPNLQSNVHLSGNNIYVNGIAGGIDLDNNGVNIKAGNSGYPNAKVKVNGQEVATKLYVDGKIDDRADPIEVALAAIEAVIPSQASAQNQLADKAFVNSSISSSTANFVGTFDSLAELQAVQNPTNNDYGFVIETDAVGNEYYDRYKYNGQAWLFEYKVESTPFTADQWAAIQSGITSALVGKLSALPTNAALTTSLNAKADKSDTYTKGEVDAALAGKENTISDLAAIRNGAAAGATAVQSVAVGSSATGAPGSNAAVVNSGTAQNPVLDFTIPRGEKGDTGSVTVTDGVAQITIVNDLTTGGTGDALSAEQGKVLESELKTNSGYYECATAMATPTKLVTAAGFKLSTGCSLKIHMAESTGIASYLNVNSTGRYTLMYNGKQASGDNTWAAGDVLYVYFTGSQYEAINLTKPSTLDSQVLANNGSSIDIVLSGKIDGMSKNLYDKNVSGVVGWVNTQGKLNGLAGYESSYLIPITEGEAYTFVSYPTFNANCYLRIVDANGVALSSLKEDGTSWGTIIGVAATPKIFIAPEGSKYAQFTTKWSGTDYSGNMMLLSGKVYTVTEYIPHYVTISKEQFDEETQAEIDSKASYVEEASKNLFDKTQVVEGKYVGYSAAGASGINSLAGAAISGFIPIEEGETYYLYRPVQESSAVPAFAGEDGTTLMSAINPSTNEIYSPYGSLAGRSAALKAPVGAKYFVFCIAFSGYEPSDCDGIQFEKGDHFTGYVDYYKKDVIPMEHLPNEVSTAMDTLTELGEEVEELSEQINGEKPNHFHCSLTEDEKSFYSIPIAGNQNYSTFRQEFYIKRSGSLSYNPNFNFGRAGYAIYNNSSSVGLLISTNSDDICPVNYGLDGMYIGYLGGNHGLSCGCLCTAASHGKTYADIGSVYSLAGHNYCIAQIVDADTIILFGENTLTYPLFKNADAAVGTYSHVSGGTNTGSIVVTAVAYTQLRPIISQPEVTVMVDDEVVTVAGEYECGYVDIIESYKIINPASLYTALVATVGTHSENPLLNEIEGLEYCARITNKYRYQDKLCIVSTSLQVIQEVRPRFFGFAQYGPVTADSTKYVYIPNLLPYGGVDYRTVQSLDAVSGQITASAEYWESGKVPSRLVEYAERGGFHTCFLPDYGFGGEIDDYTTQAFYIYTTKKYYPQPLFGHDSKDTYSLVSVKAYLERADINHDGVMQQSVFEYNGELYIFADFNASGEYRISILDKFIGHNIVTFDKTSNVTLSGDIAMNEVVIDVSVATPMYGYFCGKISK